MTPHETTAAWNSLSRDMPTWFRDAKFGIFIHWGAYSVPAWAEPTGELGAVDEATWYRHNPYAEWYFNTIRFDDSPARDHHRETYGDAPYDDFLDAWHAEAFDPASWMSLFARAGARYVVPTTKHHDGIALWDAPGTATRNTVHRGPRKDLIADLAAATRDAGLRFGVYYSGGLDWHVTNLAPLDSHTAVHTRRPVDAAYAAYAYLHVHDLVDRYSPDLLWNDIEWPDAGKHAGAVGLYELFRYYYATVPDGVVNDRWGETHWDYRTSEYQFGLDSESASCWENCRGIGYSFGYNQIEDATQSLDGPGIVRHLADVVSRGGNLLLNVGPTASGQIPQLQRRSLEQLADWMQVNGTAIHGTRPVPPHVAAPSNAPWVRWTQADTAVYGILDAAGQTRLPIRAGNIDAASASLTDGTPVAAKQDGADMIVELPGRSVSGPTVVRFEMRGGASGEGRP
jgi:alpha-L-fucosidase